MQIHERLPDLLFQALNADIGIVIRTSNPTKITQQVCEARKKTPIFHEIEVYGGRTDPNLLFFKKACIPMPKPEEVYQVQLPPPVEQQNVQ